tara:strand:- start:854 stop:1633 length:780 start_codon:yes stop_codon:yes gene_type:complete
MSNSIEDYLFDLRGYIQINQAINNSLLQKLNCTINTYGNLKPGEWKGWVHRPNNPNDIIHLHNLFEMGAEFETLIDHPSWIERVRHYVGRDDGLFIDESFVDIRNRGCATRIHSGAHKRRIRTQFRYHNGEFRCGQINVLIALDDIGEGDGATMVVPGSHKSNLLHPAIRAKVLSLDDVEGAIELPLKAGDAAMFVDCLAHGSARRIHPGQRRILIIRYGPHWGNNRYGYQPSSELLSRLTNERRAIIQPLSPLLPPSN